MRRVRKGFTLVELLVALSIIALLGGILVPVCSKARRHARTVLGMNNQRTVVADATMYAFDNDDRYPESVATIGVEDSYWNWQEPMRLTGYRARNPSLHRSMGAYLRDYVKDARLMSCPNAPSRYEYLQASWDAGDAWDNPNTDPVLDPVTGTYCFYWNYIGFLPGRPTPFRGPRRVSDSRRYSTLLVSDYFGFDHWRNPGAYGSCERFEGATVTPETWISSAYWSLLPVQGDSCFSRIGIVLHAGYTDGHLEKYMAGDVIPMLVSITDDGSEPYPSGIGPGVIYLPRNSLY